MGIAVPKFTVNLALTNAHVSKAHRCAKLRFIFQGGREGGGDLTQRYYTMALRGGLRDCCVLHINIKVSFV